jgi:hypothetical protein
MAGDALAISIPHDPFLAGTWAGDILLNSSNDVAWSKADLFSVMLHEIGHVLGLDEGTDPQSVLFNEVDPARNALSADDIAAIRALYGPRLDTNEKQIANGSMATATSIKYPVDSDKFTATTPLVAFGDITTSTDVDFLKVKSAKNYTGPMTIRVQTSGISLLEPRMTVYDSSGTVLGQAQSTNLLGSVVTVRVPQVKPDKTYYVKVESAAADEFGIGRYGVAVTFDARLAVSADQIDAMLRGTTDTQSATDSVLSNWGAEPDDDDYDDDYAADALTATSPFLAATELKTRAGHEEHTYYSSTGRLRNGDGSNYYRIEAPDTESDGPVILTAAVDAGHRDEAVARIDLFDSRGNAISTKRLVHGSGTFSVQAADLRPGATYFLKVSAADDGVTTNGKYHLTADFRQPASLVRTFSRATLSAAAPQVTDTLYVARTQLFQFILSADSPDAGAATQMSIVNQDGAIVWERTATAGDAVSGSVILSPGTYSVRFTARDASGSMNSPVTYEVSGFALSDPIGPRIENPNARPTPPPPPRPYPGLVVSDPYYWINQVY